MAVRSENKTFVIPTTHIYLLLATEILRVNDSHWGLSEV